MIRITAIFFVLFAALSLWAAPAWAHGGHYHNAAPKTSAPVIAQAEQHSNIGLFSDQNNVKIQYADDAMNIVSTNKTAPAVLVSSQDNPAGEDDPCCCNTGGSVCSPASAALLATPNLKHPVIAPARLQLPWTQMGSGRKTSPVLQPPKLIA